MYIGLLLPDLSSATQSLVGPRVGVDKITGHDVTETPTANTNSANPVMTAAESFKGSCFRFLTSIGEQEK